MHKKKKVKTIIVEKYKYDNDNNDNYGVRLAPELLLKLLEYAHSEATSDEQLHAIVTRAHVLSHQRDDDDCLWMEDYPALITNAIPVVVVTETPTEPTEPTVVPTM